MVRGLFLLALTIVLAGCASSSASIEYCAVAQPIYMSKKDSLTRQTESEIIAHNEIWERLCGGSQ